MSISCIRALAPIALAALTAMPALAAANTRSHFDCRVTGSTRLDRLGRNGQPAELSEFTCRVSGGLLDGFVANGTNIWEQGEDHDELLGSIVIVRKGDAAVVYEVQHATRRTPDPQRRGASREGTGYGLFKMATGSAAPLAGRSFRSVARSGAGGTFTVDTVVGD